MNVTVGRTSSSATASPASAPLRAWTTWPTGSTGPATAPSPAARTTRSWKTITRRPVRTSTRITGSGAADPPACLDRDTIGGRVTAAALEVCSYPRCTVQVLMPWNTIRRGGQDDDVLAGGGSGDRG